MGGAKNPNPTMDPAMVKTVRIRSNVTASVTRKFVETMKQYQSAQASYKTQVTDDAVRQVQVSNIVEESGVAWRELRTSEEIHTCTTRRAGRPAKKRPASTCSIASRRFRAKSSSKRAMNVQNSQPAARSCATRSRIARYETFFRAKRSRTLALNALSANRRACSLRFQNTALTNTRFARADRGAGAGEEGDRGVVEERRCQGGYEASHAAERREQQGRSEQQD